MDPLNFAENDLPKIEYTEKHASKTYILNDSNDYSKFKEEFLEYVSADCHAITLNDEIIYNGYKEKSVKETLQEDMIRNMIIENPHSLFVNIFRKNKDAHVIVYMFGNNPWFVAVYYKSDLDILTIEYYKSKKYMERYENVIYL
jgi:hypothetical protein